MSELFPQKERDELIHELHTFVDDKAEYLKGLILTGNIKSGSGSGESFDLGWNIGFRRAVAEMERRVESAAKDGEAV